MLESFSISGFPALTLTLRRRTIPSLVNVAGQRRSADHFVAVIAFVDDGAQVADGAVHEVVAAVRDGGREAAFNVWNENAFIQAIRGQSRGLAYICRPAGIRCRIQCPNRTEWRVLRASGPHRRRTQR